MRRDTLDFVIRSIVDWVFRARKPESWIFRGAAGVLVLAQIPNWTAKFSREASESSTSIEVGVQGGAPGQVVTVICLALMVVAVIWAIWRYKLERSDTARKKVFVIEGRGLRDDDGAPLKNAVPSSVEGARIDYLMDLRQRRDGAIIEPEMLLEPVSAMKTWLHQAQRAIDRSDLTTVYGGLTAVPLTFLTGVLLDDEGDIVVMDWDRSAGRWRLLDGEDDGQRFQIAGIEGAIGAQEVVLAISASYAVRSDDLATAFSLPVVRMNLPDLQSSHWSQIKQSELADQYFGVLKQIAAEGVDRIHMVLAGQNSLVFNLARRYDKRNLPKLIVYQYERDATPRYPWGIEMPVSGAGVARVKRLNAAPTQTHTD